MAPINSKVVVESTASQALLALAHKEGLLADAPNNDNTLSSLARRNYPSWVTAQALEQVVLFEQIHLPFLFSPDIVRGDLIESGPFYFYSERQNPKGKIREIDPAILNGLLKARGISPTPFEDPSIMEGVRTAQQQLKAWKRKYGQDVPDPMAIVMEQVLERSRKKPQKYVELEIIQRPLERFRPIVEALNDYLQLVGAAENRAAFAMTPIFDAGATSLFQPKIDSGRFNSPTTLLRLTSAKLGVLPHGQTLKGTLRIARDPATIALRVKIQEWTDSLTEDSGADTERIQREISEALGHLNKASLGSQVSNITTYLGLPTALTAVVSAFATQVGWLATIAGTIGLAAHDATRQKYRWATFGSSNKG